MDAPPRFDPDGNERLTAAAGLVLLVLSGLEIGTLLLGLQRTLSWHVAIGLMLIPPIVLKLGSTGWRFARYYMRNEDYRVKGAPQALMRILAPLLVFLTIVLFGSGVAMGFLHGNALHVARRLHGPAAAGWVILVGVHILVYLRRALREGTADVVRRSRGATWRAWALAGALVAGLAVAVATIPVQHPWLHLPPKEGGRASHDR